MFSTVYYKPALNKWAMSWENLYVNNKTTDQPVHPRSLIAVLLFDA